MIENASRWQKMLYREAISTQQMKEAIIRGTKVVIFFGITKKSTKIYHFGA